MKEGYKSGLGEVNDNPFSEFYDGDYDWGHLYGVEEHKPDNLFEHNDSSYSVTGKYPNMGNVTVDDIKSRGAKFSQGYNKFSNNLFKNSKWISRALIVIGLILTFFYFGLTRETDISINKLEHSVGGFNIMNSYEMKYDVNGVTYKKDIFKQSTEKSIRYFIINPEMSFTDSEIRPFVVIYILTTCAFIIMRVVNKSLKEDELVIEDAEEKYSTMDDEEEERFDKIMQEKMHGTYVYNEDEYDLIKQLHKIDDNT